MLWATAEIGHLFALIVMAAALGMDAFSMGIGIGMQGIRMKDAFKISFLIGIFHVIMPLAGIYTGQFVGALLGNIAVVTGGCLLILLGLHMIYSACFDRKGRSLYTLTWWSLLVIATTVSIDSFSVGISMGIFASDIVLTIILFGTAGASMSIAGLFVGNQFSSGLGEYGEMIGGTLLLIFGISVLA